MGVMQERERAVDRARKVFRHGASTTASGEKEKCVGVLVELCQKHRLVLHDLDPQFPRRLDIALLRVKIGLAGATPSAPGGAHGHQRPAGPGTRPGTRPSGGSGAQGPGRAAAGGYQRGTGADPREVLFRAMGAPARKRWLQGPAFSQGLRRGLGHTGAYERLLAEVRSLNTSNVGAGLSEPELLRWFEAVLSRQGSSVPCKPSSTTIYDDLATYCRAQYLAETEQRRQEAQRRKAEEERRRAREVRAEQDRKAAEQRRKVAEERRARERAADQGGPGRTAEPAYGAVAFSRGFEHPAEAQLYLKVARRWVGPGANLRSSTRLGRWHVEFTGSPAVRAAVESAYVHALHDLQLAAATIRAEAARRRDEALRQVEAAYSQQCEEAFQVAVESYTA
ncbi:hypothetical protein QOL99_15695 [Deinococcus sp. MIMF12]|uniref:Uncharacterized protein n=1 Tax=Deinococcus rhizophilus TaxID=3049544 RepID=A0ABT7JKK1_9DEIO|nr:hypothetical protein [Deinococcus rhizophilus]MDL2345580.1 hypothetical protein [Deinococcus rhizophilus]